MIYSDTLKYNDIFIDVDKEKLNNIIISDICENIIMDDNSTDLSIINLLSYEKILTKKNNVAKLFKNALLQIKLLKNTHSEYSKIKPISLHVHALDSVFFQSKLYNLEIRNMTTLFQMLNNKMYCEYYKLYSTIKSEHIFPIYNDMDNLIEYDDTDISDIFQEIKSEIMQLNLKTIELNKIIDKYKMQQSHGVNIDNFIASNTFELNILKEKIKLYNSQFLFFYKIQIDRYYNMENKLKLLFLQNQTVVFNP